jgi:hypothetical protein
VSTKADIQRGKLQLQAQGWVHHLRRRSRYFRDPAFTDMSSFENLKAPRIGAMALATPPIGKEQRWAASATLDHARADVTNSANTVEGDVTILETAVNYQLEHGPARVDAAAGLAIPFGVGADPWPEGKLVGRWRPSYGPVELALTGARKGRVPSLRERFEPGGNPALAPEQATHTVLRTIYNRGRLRLEAAPFYRRTNGTVRASTDPADMGMLVNLGTLDFYGIDTAVRVALPRNSAVGGSYGYIHVDGDTPIDRLPSHHADLWYESRIHPRLNAIARGKYVGDSVDRSMPVYGYMLIELTFTAQLSRGTLAVLRIDDLADERPETRAGYFSPGRTATLIVQGQWN